MAEAPLHILQVSTHDIAGGAERVAWDLFRSYRARGCDSHLAVGYKHGDDPEVLVLPNAEPAGAWGRFWWRRQAGMGDRPDRRRLRWLLRRVAEPVRSLELYAGVEDFHFPGSRRLPELTERPPDIVHCHNLHGGYFDLRVLASLSRRLPVVLTLHDAWLLSGHCAHSLNCERWKIGCGHCPDLTLFPAVPRDATAYNWRRKRAIYRRSRLRIATPSRWLMNKVEQSILVPAVHEARVIPNGVDLNIFRPAEREAARRALDLPPQNPVLLFTANSIRKNVWKDYQALRAAVEEAGARLAGQPVLFLALGEDGPPEQIGRTEIRFVPYQTDPRQVARYYQAADLYLHAAREEVWGLTVTEALACGVPVVATATGGIPEQVKGLQGVAGAAGQWSRYDAGEATGVLVTPGDAPGLAAGVVALLQDKTLRGCLGDNAARDAASRFGLESQVDNYLAWYREILTPGSS